jgi:peptidoglycan/LPS O-acetylase OafA/YrhL
MGTYRLLLAMTVLLFHAGVTIGGRAIGVSAVVSFFLISGYVMTALVDRHYSRRIGGFYIDRTMRLFPQFIFYVVAWQAVVWIFHPASPFVADLTIKRAVLNMTMVGLNFPGASIMPQAWSLGLEWQFYLLLPFMLRARVATFIASLTFYAIVCATGWADPYIWGYIMFPGTAFMFLIGSFLYRGEKLWLWLVYIALCAGFAIVYATPSLQSGCRFEVLAGLVIGIPILRVLSTVRFGRFDALLGNLSYGVFLNHAVLILLFPAVGLAQSSALYLPTLLITSLALAWLSYEFIEKRVIAVRHRIRNRTEATDGQPVDRSVGAGNHNVAPPTTS